MNTLVTIPDGTFTLIVLAITVGVWVVGYIAFCIGRDVGQEIEKAKRRHPAKGPTEVWPPHDSPRD